MCKSIELLFDSTQAITSAQNIKGWLFIVVTSLLLFVLIRRDMNRATRMTCDLVESYEQTISGWVHVMDLRHRETKDHTERVTRMTLELALLAGIDDPEQLKQIRRGAILHDIGKIGIPDAILVKNGDTVEYGQPMFLVKPN